MKQRPGLATRSVRDAIRALTPLRGPDFSTYDPQDVGWLLTDVPADSTVPRLAHVPAYLRKGIATELAPAPYAPSPEYMRLLDRATERHAAQTALAVGTLTDAVLSTHRAPIIVSIMRAGVPIGVLMHRWAARRGVELPHYAISIVQEAGIDPAALRWLAEHHDPTQIVFVDGWTGKGTVALTLQQCLDKADAEHGVRLPSTFGVLADPGNCTSLHGTREDFLIPSAGLDSTATGLISRSVYHPDLTGPVSFHAAAFHRHLAEADTSRGFLEAVTARFDQAGTALAHDSTPHGNPDWSGRRAAEAIASCHHLDHVDLVKPGVCETTRVLVQWKVNKLLIRHDAERDLEHILLLASERGTTIDYAEEIPFACVALVPPRPVLASATPATPYR
jgi:hypothetical protein